MAQNEYSFKYRLATDTFTLTKLFNFNFWIVFVAVQAIKKFMDERAGYYNKLDNEAIDKLKQAENLKISYEERLGDIEKRLKEEKHVLLRKQR